MEEACECVSNLRVDVEHHLRREPTDELSAAVVQELDDEVIEREASLKQPVEQRRWHARDARIAQCDDVVASRLALHERSLSEPAARAHAGEGQRAAVA